MRRYLWVVALTISAAAQSQKIADPKAFANTITADDLKKHLYIVAGKEMEGRETATEGERKAAAYIENHFRALGLAPGNNGSYQMMWPLFRDSLAGASLEVNGKAFSVDKDFAINLSSAFHAMRAAQPLRQRFLPLMFDHQPASLECRILGMLF